MAVATKYRRRGGRKASPQLARPDYPYTMKLADGRTLYVELPGRWVTEDRGAQVVFLPEAVDFLDRVRALALSALDRAPTPGYITRLREGLGLTQQEFGEKVSVDKMTVSRWERGTVRPSVEALDRIEKLRREAVRRGVSIPG